MGEISVKTGNNARNGGKNSLNRLIRCVCGKKIGPDPRNFNQRVSLGRNDLLIRTFPSYFLTYLFPLISGPDAFMDVRIASFFALSLFFYISFSGSYSFNPLLSFWGYKYYEAEDDTGVSFVVLSKKPLLRASGKRIDLIKLTDYTYIAI
ncbi:hypothetical protein OI978_04060 [Serratia nevei]|uniref:hypothetical protein n=1 Tax=Serratia nevei TaxID=2703794 RepID=UPI0025431321|nr:hypothetical protein [Serratia nevei]WIJ65181.1 hypothetical protein OI978_04060 [Serratia nevei]